MVAIEVRQLSYSYLDKEVLSKVSFTINRAESFGIIGPNGSGKTTLLRAITGMFPDMQGEVLLNGKAIAKYRKKELAKFAAFVEQEGTPPLAFTVEEIVSMGRYPWLKPFAEPSLEDYRLIKEALINLDIWHLREKPVYALSGGERQMVSLARAIVQEPEVLFLDEPTTYLDIGHQSMVMKHVRKWQKEKKATVIMVLHDLNLAAQYCDRLLLLNKSSIQTIGTVQEVMKEHNLEMVYKTKTVMIEHPISKTPQILLAN